MAPFIRNLALLLFSLCFAASHATAIARADEPTITVSGEAEIRVVPDQVIVSAGIESRMPTVKDAVSDNDAKIKAILDFLKTSGIEEKHIRTEFISIAPIFRTKFPYGGKGVQQAVPPQANNSADPFNDDLVAPDQKIVGYLASRQFAITVMDLKNFESVYKGLVERGINRVQGIEFRTSELRKHRDQARLNAVRAAREKAVAMAGELGAEIASIKTMLEKHDGAGFGRMVTQNSLSDPFSGAMANDSAFAAGQISISASVEIVFYLDKTSIKR
jgi:uncharacterized protein YggE